VATLLSPRPLPARRLPVAGGALVVAFCLPVFVLAGWSLRGWALGAVLWLASQALGILFDRFGIHEPTLRGSGVVAFGMMTRGILVMLVAIVIAVSDPKLALAGALVYAFAYSLELAFSLVLYFGGRPAA
jgi:4-hydroxybenzoate polyprenyltransferase